MRLLESSPPRRRARAGTAVSIVVHVLLIGGAVVATASAGAPPDRDVTDVAIYVVPPKPAEPAPSAHHTAGVGSAVPNAPPLPAVSLPPIDHVVAGIPEPAPADPLRGLEESFDRGLRGGAGSGGESGSVRSGDAPWDASVVDRAVVPLGTLRPHYPETMRAMGRSGRAVVRFVVDTLGRVERDGITLVTATDPAFGDAALRAVPGLRFRPAEARGRKVRQLVELPFDFVLQ